MKVYYNEFNRFAADWLCQLMAHGLLPKGDVDDTPIQEVKAQTLEKYTQCHFFAGIGVWPYALTQAGWDERPVWTGSCPCQPFSSAGQHKGTSDKRHLWPIWYRLIRELRPNAIFGEQVAGKNGLNWFDAVSADLENSNYAVGAACTNACSFGAPHQRHRLYYVATLGNSNRGRQVELQKRTRREIGNPSERTQILADASLQRLERPKLRGSRNVGKQSCNRSMGLTFKDSKETPSQRWNPEAPWQEFDRLPTKNGKKERPVEPGTLPLAYGTPTSVGRVRGYGNALCAPQAQGFIEAFLEI